MSSIHRHIHFINNHTDWARINYYCLTKKTCIIKKSETYINLLCILMIKIWIANVHANNLCLCTLIQIGGCQPNISHIMPHSIGGLAYSTIIDICNRGGGDLDTDIRLFTRRNPRFHMILLNINWTTIFIESIFLESMWFLPLGLVRWINMKTYNEMLFFFQKTLTLHLLKGF